MEDSTSWLGNVVFWTLSELTCGFIVLTLPSVAKCCPNSGVGAIVESRMRNWTERQDPEMSGRGNKSLRSSTPISCSDEYQMIDEHGLPMANLKSDVSISERGLDPLPKHGGIMQTTNFTTQESYRKDGDETWREGLDPGQHPWIA